MDLQITISCGMKELGAQLINALYEYSFYHGNNLPMEKVTPEDVKNDGAYAFLDGAFVGGVLFYASNDWLFLTSGIVFEPYRNKGIYKAVIKKLEEYAKENGLSGIFVSTYDFQAPWFYEKNGFKQGAVLHNCPAGNTSIDYYKSLKTTISRNYVVVCNRHKGLAGALLFWGVKTKDNEERSYGGYTSNLNYCEKYTLEEAKDRRYNFHEYTGNTCDWKKFDDFYIRIDQIPELGYRPMLIYYR